jgi:predicted metal-dependent phosphoesterase TrpH
MTKKLAIGFAALVAIGAIAGTLYDTPTPNDRVERGGMRVLEVDFHTHTRFSDGFLSPFEAVIDARRHGLDAFAVTEHNAVVPGKMARWFSNLIGGPTVIVGEEVTTSSFHVIGIGLDRAIDPPENVGDALNEIHAQGGVAIAAHPAKRFWPVFDPVRDRIDAAEVLHPVAYSESSSGGFRWDDMVEFYERAHRDGHAIAAVGSSDYHFFRTLGICRTLVFTTDPSERGIVEALRDGHTVVLAPDGRRFGDPELLALLDREPMPERSTIATYDAVSPLDWITRALGFFGVVGLFFVWRRGAAATLPP